MAVARSLRGTASGYAAHLAWTEALYREPGQRGASVRRALALVENVSDEPGTMPRFRAGAALAIAGFSGEAMPLVTGAEHAYPEATFVRTVLGPVTRAAAALHQQKPDLALEALDTAALTELGTVAGLVPPYLRGEALMQKGSFAEAAREYQKVLDRRGVDPFAPMVPLAQLGLARAHARRADITASRAAYEALFAIWKTADADFSPLVAARAEYARLAGTTTQ
jgi:eukaryotic-like serine/threonine-protein kinase